MNAARQTRFVSRGAALGGAVLLLVAGCEADGPVRRGRVVDTAGQPVADARVRLQGDTTHALTDAAGEFRLRPLAASGRFITAGKSGYYNQGVPYDPALDTYTLVLHELPPGDNTGYAFVPTRPRKGASADACLNCHPDQTRDWEASAHGGAVTNPLFRRLLDGRGAGPREPVYRKDFPGSPGNCVSCHAPLLALDHRHDFEAVAGAAREGIACDFCHKIADVRQDDTGGLPGILSITLKRPPPGQKLLFGPLDDVAPRNDSYHPLYRDSRYCVACHHGRFWGVLVYSEFEEWRTSPYAREGIQCQGCHMRPDGRRTHIAPPKEGGVARDPASFSTHRFPGPSDAPFMRGAIALGLTAVAADAALDVGVSVENIGAGHHLPSGSPLRNLVLLVEARDANNRTLPLVRGDTVPAWGGRGSPALGNYAGLPGKGYAKLFAERREYPADPRRGRKFSAVYPAPFWRPVIADSDNRIPARGRDSSHYRFAAPPGTVYPLHITARLIYRRSFRSWYDPARPGLDDLALATQSTIVDR